MSQEMFELNSISKKSSIFLFLASLVFLALLIVLMKLVRQSDRVNKKSRNTLNSIINNSSTIIYLKDKEGKYILINKQYEKIFHLKNDEIVGKTDFDIFPEDIAKRLRENDLRILALKKPIELEEEVPHDDESHSYISVKFPLFNIIGDPYAVCGISTNITDLKKVVKEKSELQAQIVHAGKLAGLGTLSAGICHELNNPLTIVMGFADSLNVALENENHHTEKTKIYYQRINEAAQRMKIIIDHVREFSRDGENQEREDFNPNDIIRKSLILLNQQLKLRQIRIDLELTDNLPKIWINAVKIESVLQNLLSNSRDAFENYVPKEEKFIKISTSLLEDGKNISFTVEDNGKGISKKDLNNIFDPFFTTKEVGSGTGLGLSLSYGIIKEHKGEIIVESTEAVGTTFRISLPIDMRAERKDKHK